MIDLILSTKKNYVLNERLATLFLKLIPKNATVIMMMADKQTLYRRKAENIYDVHYEKRINLYLYFSKKYNIPLIDATVSIQKNNTFLIKT